MCVRLISFYELKMCLVKDQDRNFHPGFLISTELEKKFHIELFSNSGTKWQFLGVFVFSLVVFVAQFYIAARKK